MEVQLAPHEPCRSDLAPWAYFSSRTVFLVYSCSLPIVTDRHIVVKTLCNHLGCKGDVIVI